MRHWLTNLPIMRPTSLFVVCAALPLASAPAWAGAGEKMYKEFQENGQIYADERWQRYVQDIGQRLLANAPKRGKDYHYRSLGDSSDGGADFHFYVTDSEHVNAFTTGDPYIFISRGLLPFMESEEQLAAVIGHEIGHVIARHMTKRRLANVTGKALGLAASWLTLRPELERDVSNPLTNLLLSGHGREMELEADRIGGELMAYAGYNPDAIINAVWALKDHQMFTKKVARKRVSYHGVFASHPRNDLRLHQAVAYARSLAKGAMAEPTGDFWTLMDGLAYGDEAAGGLVRDGSFYHSGLRVVVPFPDGWALSANRSQVRGQAPGGSVEGFITVAHHAHVKRTSPRKYVTKVLKRDDLLGGEDLQINDQPAFIGELDTGESSVQLQLIAVLYRGKNVFLFKGECGEQGDPDSFRADFRAMVDGLRGMTEQDAQMANTRRVEVLMATPGLTYAKLAENTTLREYAVETLRLLNADYPNGEPRPGDHIKVVR